MNSPQKNGKDFDIHVNNILKKTNETIVLDEIEISRKYGNEFRAIDSMIITNFNYIVFLQRAQESLLGCGSARIMSDEGEDDSSISCIKQK